MGKGSELEGEGREIEAARHVRQAELRERAQDRLMRTCVDEAAIPTFVLDRSGAICYTNQAACDALDYHREELLARHVWDINPDFPEAQFPTTWRRLKEAGLLSVETTHRRKDGTTFPVVLSAKHIDFEGDEYVYTVARDISDLRHGESARIAEIQRERDTLIREVHHRIKNHLQGVVGLLRQHEIDQPVVMAALEEAIGQIRAIAVVHGIYSGAATSDVRLCSVVAAIAAAAPRPLTTRLGACQTTGRPCPMRVHDEEAVPLALVLNELITNAVKHSAGEVRVEVDDQERGATISVRNVVGSLPAGFDWEAGLGLGTGLRLVRRLLPHPGAHLEICDTTPGVVARLALEPSVVSYPEVDCDAAACSGCE